ncbi:MAG: AAA family ATPase, partial [Promethearchaeota archaeon]
LDEIGITELITRDTTALSGGQKQLVSLASILIMRPKILVLDEPTSYLDPIYANRIFNILKKIQQSGTTIILVSHNAEILGELAERILVVDKGQIVGNDKPNKIFSNIEFLNKYKLIPPPITKLFLDLKKRINFDFEIPVKFSDGITILNDFLCR